MVLLRFLLPLFFVITATAPALAAQIDRARGGNSEPADGSPWGQFYKYYRETVTYADQNNRDAALQSSNEMAKALNAVFDFTKDIPSRLNANNLRDLGSRSEEFLAAIRQFRDSESSLQDKLKRGGESYSSELSSFRNAFATLNAKFIGLWGGFQDAGKDIGGKYEAIKATCMVGCLPR